jgi:hypothetical protein
MFLTGKERRRTAVGKISLVIVALSLAASAQEDVLKLKSGARFEGRIVAETERTITVQFPGGNMEIKRDLIAEIIRGGTAARGGEAVDSAPLLAGLTRFRDSDEWFFLYQAGRRVGWRTVTTRREVRRDVAGYVRRDRIVFTAQNGGPAEVDLNLMEFVDAELKPLELQQRLSAGASSRLVEGARSGEHLRLVDRGGGQSVERLALFREGVELPGFLLRRLAVSPVPEGGYPTYQVFDPRELEFADLGVQRRLERVNLRGQVLDVLIFRRSTPAGALETWFDLSGRAVREEIGSRSLVAIAAEQKQVEAFWAGDRTTGPDDLGLTVACDDSGLRLDRPDLSWDVQPGNLDKNLLTSLIKASSRATVEVFEVKAKGRALTEESAAYEILGRLQKNCEGFKLEGPTPQTIGQSEGLRFTVDCKRRESTLRTLGFIIPRERRVFVVLCAAPTERYAEVHPSFLRILQSIKVEKDGPPPEPSDPHAEAQKALAGS